MATGSHCPLSPEGEVPESRLFEQRPWLCFPGGLPTSTLVGKSQHHHHPIPGGREMRSHSVATPTNPWFSRDTPVHWGSSPTQALLPVHWDSPPRHCPTLALLTLLPSGELRAQLVWGTFHPSPPPLRTAGWKDLRGSLPARLHQIRAPLVHDKPKSRKWSLSFRNHSVSWSNNES